MQKWLQATGAVFLAVLLILPMKVSGYATVKASDYFSVTQAWATALGGGKVLIEFDMGTTHTMTELGAQHIVIYEQRASDGGYKSVKTYSRYNTNGLMDGNSTSAYGSVTYSGTSGKKYYAKVTFYAKDDDGSETLNQYTNKVTA